MRAKDLHIAGAGNWQDSSQEVTAGQWGVRGCRCMCRQGSMDPPTADWAALLTAGNGQNCGDKALGTRQWRMLCRSSAGGRHQGDVLAKHLKLLFLGQSFCRKRYSHHGTRAAGLQGRPMSSSPTSVLASCSISWLKPNLEIYRDFPTAVSANTKPLPAARQAMLKRFAAAAADRAKARDIC